MKKRPPWWGYVKAIIKEYPELQKEINTPLQQRTTVRMDIIKTKGDIQNPTRDCVIHNLPDDKQKRYEAVHNAIIKTEVRHPGDSDSRLKVIDLVYFKKTHTIQGAALKIGCHENTAGRWQAEFIRTVKDELNLP